MSAGTAKEMILVHPDAFTIYNGSMYSNSPTTGDKEHFVANDLVAYVDSHYRTIPDRMSRGLAGHSMGGYGRFDRHEASGSVLESLPDELMLSDGELESGRPRRCSGRGVEES